ncbi:MAG: hypothetical protein ACX94C_09785 [Phycisphaerales bacterium]
MKNVLCAVALAGLSGSVVAGEVFNQGFETDTSGWFDENNGWSGTIDRVSSGTDGITSASGAYHANFGQSNGDGGLTAGFTRFDGYRDTWSGPYQASVAIYLDTNWTAGEGFDYSVASSNSSGSHLRDFIFHVTKDTSTGQLLVGGSNNTNFDPIENLETGNHAVIGTSGWYTFEHSFYDAGDGTLAVALNLYDAGGSLIFQEIRNNAGDHVGSIAGGNRYGWFTNIDIAGGINVDDHTLTVVPLPPAAFAGLGMLAGFAGVRKLRQR